VISTPDGMLVRRTCHCGKSSERLIDERPFIETSPLDVCAQTTMRELTHAVAFLRDEWAPGHTDCPSSLAGWSGGDAAERTAIAGSAQSNLVTTLHDVPPSMRFLDIMPPALIAAAQKEATAHAQALAQGERRHGTIALVLAPVDGAVYDDLDIKVEMAALILGLAPRELRGQLSSGTRGAAELMAFYKHVLREHARAIPDRVLRA
jgi:hypothetical protein